MSIGDGSENAGVAAVENENAGGVAIEPPVVGSGIALNKLVVFVGTDMD